ncbi:MAG: IclR family transcriptional regulator [Methanosarcinaceae archaeon]|nr:IclR family transcriptional regulator [Methanosarcinaceae archaeon]
MILSTLEKGISLIELLSRNLKGMPLVGISKTLGISKSSIHHMLQTYLAHGYVVQDPETRKYALGLKFLQISSKILESFDIREIAKKNLIHLHEKSKEIVQLYILRNGRMVCIDKIGAPTRGLSISSFVGWTTDPHPAAAGKVLLCELSLDEISGIYPNRVLKVYGKNTMTDFDEFLKELQMIKTQGYAIDDEEYYEGVRCVSAPIRAGGKIVASVSITGSIFRMTMKKINQNLIPLVTMTGKKISNEMIDVHL